MGKRWLCAALVLLILLCPFCYARAAAPLGTIKVRMTCRGIGVEGGELTLYRAGDPAGDGFVLTEPFSRSGVSLEDIHSPDTARQLAEFGSLNSVQGETAVADSNGCAEFTELPEGLYLIAETSPAEGYLPVSPFLVELPQVVDGVKQYHIEAAPKMQPEKPEQPDDPNQPQTGQRNLPMLILSAGGMLCSGAGLWLLLIRKKKPDEE